MQPISTRPAYDDLEKKQLLAQLQESMFGRNDRVELGRYALVQRLGSGAMGVVYIADDPRLRRRVALKLLHPARREADADAGHRRLRAEARALGQVMHPNVIEVYDVGRAGDRVYVAMELVRGLSLQAWLDAQPRPWVKIVELFVQAGRGLDAAHKAGVVHRDFKPSNVQVGDDGRVRVLDFGLAKATPLSTSTHRDGVASAPSTAAVTLDGALVGTPRYMAPDQLRGAPADAYSDQYAFCVALHEALFGEAPFDPERILAATEPPPRPPLRPSSAVPLAIQRSIRRGLSAKPSDRFFTMAELLDRLAPQPRRRRRLGAGVVVGAAAVVAGFVAWPRGEPGPATPGVDTHLDPSDDPALRAARAPWVQQTTAELDAVRTLLRAQENRAADVLSDLLLQRARAIGDRPLLAQAGVQRGTALARLERFDAAIETLAAAHTDAVTGRDDRTRAEAAIVLAQIELHDLRDREAAVRWIRDAKSLEGRLDAFPQLAFELAKLDVAVASGQPGGVAVDAAHAAVALARATWGERGPNVALALKTLATELFRGQRLDEARAAIGEALALEQARADRDEILIANCFLVSSMIDSLDGLRANRDPVLFQSSIDSSRKATAAFEAAVGPENPRTLAARVNTGIVLAKAERFDEAREVLEAVIPKLGPNSLEQALEALGSAQLELGELEEAQANLQRAVILIESSRGSEHPALGSPLYFLAKVQDRRGLVDLSRSNYERALVIAPNLGPGAVASVYEGLANLEASAGNSARAVELYELSAEAWAEAAGPDAPQIRSVRTAAAALRAD